MTLDNRSFIKIFTCPLIWGRERREGEGRGREGSKTISAQNRALQLSAINLIGLTNIFRKIIKVFESNVLVNSKPDYPPPGNSFNGPISHPLGKKRVQNPTPGPIKTAKTPPLGAFSTIKTSKNETNHVKLQDFIIFRRLKDKLGLRLRPRLHVLGKFTLINCKTL